MTLSGVLVVGAAIQHCRKKVHKIISNFCIQKITLRYTPAKRVLIRDTPAETNTSTYHPRDERCHFLRVDKEDFNRILRDVEAKTERLKENGKDVLVLEKLSRTDGSQRLVKLSPCFSLKVDLFLNGDLLPGSREALR